MHPLQFFPTPFKLISLGAAGLLFLLGWAAVPVLSAPTATLTVNGAGDLNDLTPGDGTCDTSPVPGSQCSLRAAIEEANALGSGANPHRIEFNLAGTGPFVIAPASPLPDITVPVAIDGATQPGAACPSSSSPAALLIVLDGSSAGIGTNGLVLDAGSQGSTLRGLVIGNFDGNGIRILSYDNLVRCTYIGIGADGVTGMGNGDHGILINGDNNIIGGQNAVAQRNVIANNNMGIRIEGSVGNRIRNNYIGTTADGMSAQGNSYGIYDSGDSNSIGSEAPLGGNLISGNIGPGIRLNTAQFTTIQGNTIGLARDGLTPLPNSGNGIEILGDALSNTIGGAAPGQANHIEQNGGHGITLQTNITGDPIQNAIRGNAIYANTGLGIDLGSDGPDSNDTGDADSKENQRQNYPVLQSSASSPVITGAIESLPGTQYGLDIYRNDQCDPSGNGEGQEHILEVSVTTDASGHAGISLDLTGLAASGDGITATATDPDGNTSEFSACVEFLFAPTPSPTMTGSPTFTPTPTATLTSSPTASPSPTPSPTPTLPFDTTPTPEGSLFPPYRLYMPINIQ